MLSSLYPTHWPLTQRWKALFTPAKCRKTRRPAQAAGTSKVVR